MTPLLLYSSKALFETLKGGKRICYLGFDYEKRLRLIQAGIALQDISNLLEKVANELKYDFIDYDPTTEFFMLFNNSR